jgi:hypothetical protein
MTPKRSKKPALLLILHETGSMREKMSKEDVTIIKQSYHGGKFKMVQLMGHTE